MSQAADHKNNPKTQKTKLYLEIDFVTNDDIEIDDSYFFFHHIMESLQELTGKKYRAGHTPLFSKIEISHDINAYKAYDAWIMGDLDE